MSLSQLSGELGETVGFEHLDFAGGLGLEGGQSFGRVDLVEGRDAAGGVAGAVGGGTGRSFGMAAFSFLAGSADAEAGELGLGGARDGVAIGFVVFEHVPGESDEFAGGGDDGDVAVLLLGEAAEEDAERPGLRAEVLRSLDEQPAGVTAALLGDGAVIAVRAGLMGGGNEAEVGGGFVGRGETGNVAEGGEQGLGDGEVDAGQGHEEAGGRIVVRLAGEAVGEQGGFGFDVGELAEMAVQGGAAGGIEVERGGASGGWLGRRDRRRALRSGAGAARHGCGSSGVCGR